MSYKWGSIVPLIGGMTIGGKNATGADPSFLLTYTPFKENEKSLVNYFPNTPYYDLAFDKPTWNLSNGQSDVDFVNALCPCAGLSMLSSGGKEVRESRNSWMFETAEYVLGEVRPRVFWGENAPTFYTNAGKGVRERLVKIAEKNGYSFSTYHTNTLLHGVPQSRTRTFYFFWRDSNPPLLNYFDKPWKNFKDYMAEVPANVKHHMPSDLEDAKERLFKDDKLIAFLVEKHGDDYLKVMRESLYEMDKNSLSILAYVIDKDYLDEAAEFFRKNNWERETRWLVNLTEKFRAGKGIWDGTLQLVRPDGHYMTLIHRNMTALHPTEDRALTLRECMHLMALPHDFELVTTEWNHVCQNVPVCTATDMTAEVMAYLNGEREISSSKILYQSNNKKRIDYASGDERLVW